MLQHRLHVTGANIQDPLALALSLPVADIEVHPREEASDRVTVDFPCRGHTPGGTLGDAGLR